MANVINTPEGKIDFINTLLNTQREALIEMVKRMPDSWDGLELRQLVADQAVSNAKWVAMSNKRKRAYKNAVMTRGIW